MALLLVMILAAPFVAVAVGLVIVQRRSDRRRAHLLAGDASIHRRS